MVVFVFAKIRIPVANCLLEKRKEKIEKRKRFKKQETRNKTKENR